jgi:hypothetical protein
MTKKRSKSHGCDCIRIVPLATPEVIGRAAAAAAAARLVYNNGPLITQGQVFTIFWGSAWQQASHSGLIAEVNGFFDFVLASELIDQLTEYSVAQYQIGPGKRIGTLTLANPDVKSSVDDSAIQQLIEQQISAGKLPKANANLIYFVFLPSGVTVTQRGAASCKVFCGYHDAISNQVFYAVMPFPDCSGCSSSLASLDALTVTASHELCEAITDPIPGQGWYDDANGEIGDICAWQTKKIGQYTVQKEWSNKSGSCV